MPPLRAFENLDAGGVDSRSNPINFPRNRALRCLNWTPLQAGYWAQRWGYSSVTMSSSSATAISGMFPYRTWDGKKYVLFMQGTSLNVIDTATGTVATPTVEGTAIASSAKGQGYFAANRFHYGNGTDQKWFDSNVWRNNGLPALTPEQVQFVTITEGVRELTPAEVAAVTLTPQASGTFPGDVLTGRLLYCAIFDTSNNEIGPATIPIGSGRVVVPLNDEIAIAGLPDLSGENTNWVKLIGGTADGSDLAYFFTTGSKPIESATYQPNIPVLNWSITSAISGAFYILTVSVETSSPHNLAPGMNVQVFGFGVSGVYVVASTPDSTHFTYTYPSAVSITDSGTGGGITGLSITVLVSSHGLSNGDVYAIAGTNQVDGIYRAVVIDANALSIPPPQGTPPLTSSSTGTINPLVTVANSATSVNISSPIQAASYQVNQNRGLAASTIGGPNPGYQFAFSIYNPNGGGHVGNFILAGQRALQTSHRSNWRINGLPNLISTDMEWSVLIGRTLDGGQTPYVCSDNAGNWAYSINGQISFVLTQPNLDGQHEMPFRNGIIPAQCNMFCVAGNFVYAADSGSPYLRRSGDLSQNTEQGDTFTGRAEQSWAPDDLDTFPTAEALTGIFEIDQEVLCGTVHDTAISSNLAGIQQWVGGPWQIGIAGPRAGTKCGSWGLFWVSGEKQLCTLQQGVPVAVSEEYELAELTQIGDAYLSQVECVYYRNAALNKDELRIEGRKADGSPYTVIHDFRLRDFNAPGSWTGQGYSSQFLGPLATAFTSAQIRDGNGKIQIWAGAANGRIYQQYTGANDAGNEFTSDLILLVNGGPNRPDVPFVDYYGDANIKITVGRNFHTSLAPGAQYGFDPPNPDADQAQAVPEAEEDFLYRFWLIPPQVQRLYVRFELTSHSVDGSLALNSPPHIPLESYGRLYELIPAVGDERER